MSDELAALRAVAEAARNLADPAHADTCWWDLKDALDRLDECLEATGSTDDLAAGHDFDPWDEATFEGECERCHHQHLVVRTEDPFLAEIHKEHVERVICHSCYQDLADDI